MTAPVPPESREALSPEAFRRRTRELGLRLLDEDIAELHRGWISLQPFLARIRTGLRPLQRPDADEPPAQGDD